MDFTPSEKPDKQDAIALTFTHSNDKDSAFGRHQEASRPDDNNFAAVLASSYLKYCQASSGTDQDSAEQFIALYQIHQQLSEQMKTFLHSRLPIIRENEPVAPMLLQFARWRRDNADELGLEADEVQAEQTAVEAIQVPVFV